MTYACCMFKHGISDEWSLLAGSSLYRRGGAQWHLPSGPHGPRSSFWIFKKEGWVNVPIEHHINIKRGNTMIYIYIFTYVIYIHM